VIVDSSVFLAVIFRVSGHQALIERLIGGELVAAGAPTIAETGLVLHARLGSSSHGMLERVLDEFSVEAIPFGDIHWRETIDAYRRYGQGRHAAALNFGDCMSYAVAKLAGEPLLFVGRHFQLTDIYVA
jgi:ribonuclease VapC